MHDPSQDPFSGPVAPRAGLPHVPGYRVQKRLGRGGMASVYLATQESLDRPVAIKVIAPEALKDEVSKVRFENEARTIARLAHPGIVGIHEVGRTEEGQLYYVMPYLGNGDLSRRDLRGDEAGVVEILRTLLQALGHAHAQGIVHRDVKRENVLFDTAGRPQLTDFGIALSTVDTSRITKAGIALGSSGTMAPEQARGVAVDGRADLYSVGVLAYDLLVGQLPYACDDPLALALMHAQDPVPRLPPEKAHWQPFIDRAMAKAPEQRYADAKEMLAALEAIATPRPGAMPPGQRQRLILGAAALALVAVVLLAAWVLWPAEESAAPPPAQAVAPHDDSKPSDAEPLPAPEPTGGPATEMPPPADTPSTPPTEAAPTPASPPANAPPPEPPKPTLRDRARKAKGKIKSWFHKH